MPKPKPPTPMHYMGIRIEKDVWRKLQERARPESAASLVRRVLREFVEKEGE
jgi:hypothetical protein